MPPEPPRGQGPLGLGSQTLRICNAYFLTSNFYFKTYWKHWSGSHCTPLGGATIHLKKILILWVSYLPIFQKPNYHSHTLNWQFPTETTIHRQLHWRYQNGTNTRRPQARRPYGPTAPQATTSTTVNTTSIYTEQLWAHLFPLWLK